MAKLGFNVLQRPAALPVAAELEALERLDLGELRVQYRNRTGRIAPARISRPLLLGVLAQQVQVEAFGDIGRDTRRMLDRLAATAPEGQEQGAVRAEPAPFTIKPGTLLSFAQFEREVTGERIRDKIAASKKKGIWVGGVVPMGYRLVDRKLLIDEAEAQTVKLVFERYLALGSLSALQRELRQKGVLTRERPLASGTIRGGGPLTNGPLNHMLRNRMYVGELNHRDTSYPGEHAPIVDQTLFDAVQAKLSENLQERRSRRSHSDALLTGRLFDDRGSRMSPTYAVKKGLRYRPERQRAWTRDDNAISRRDRGGKD